MLRILHYTAALLAVLATCCLSGCGSTKSRAATEQLLVSDAVDRSIASIDFRPLTGKTVYLDTQYVKSVKGTGFVNADYIISSLRQQMLAANCYLEEDRNKAEYVAELRVGALGTDAHSITYGIPASNSLSSAASLVPNAPPIPMIPEISLAKKEDEVAAAKIAIFAYHRDSRHAVWQSGIAQARSSAKDSWFLGAGPFQSGTIHERPQFAGENLIPELDIPLLSKNEKEESRERFKQYGSNLTFDEPPSPEAEQSLAKQEAGEGGKVKPASHQKEAEQQPAKKPAASAPKPTDQPK